MIDLEIQHLEAQYQGFIIKVENMENEMQMFKDLLEEVCESPEGKHSDGRTILEAIQDISIREKYEAEYWTFRMAKQTAMDMIAYGRAGVGNMDSIAMLEGEQQQAIMKIACDYFVRNENRTKHLNYLYVNSIDFINEFFKLDNKFKNTYSKKLFNFLDNNTLFKKYSIILADKGLS